MTNVDIEKLITAILNRGNPKYTTPSGAFLELLHEYAAQDRLEVMASAIEVYSHFFPGGRPFICTQVPAILVNKYFCVRQDLDFNAFAKWSLQEKDWAKTIRNSCNKPELIRNVVEHIIQDVIEFKRKQSANTGAIRPSKR